MFSKAAGRNGSERSGSGRPEGFKVLLSTFEKCGALSPKFPRIKIVLKSAFPCTLQEGGGGETMDEKRIEQLYRLLERAEREKDHEAAAALRWAIYTLENR